MHLEEQTNPLARNRQIYARATNCFAPAPKPSQSSAKPARTFTVARYALDASVLPLVQDTLPVAEQVRRSLLATCKFLVRRDEPRLDDADIWPLSPAFWGKDEHARPGLGHQHAFFLPADEDDDGRIDHVTLFAPMGFNPLEQHAIDKLRRMPFRDANPLRLLRIGLGNSRDFRAPLLDESAVWLSATPFVVTRYPKRRGAKCDNPEHYATPADFTRHVLHEELKRRPELPPVVLIEEEPIGKQRLRPIQFQRFSHKQTDDGGRRPAAGFRITFAASVPGPLCLGHSSHFGLGLFVPTASSPNASREAKC